MRAKLLLLLLLFTSFALPANFVEADGNVYFDGKLVAQVNSSLPLYVSLPLVPGNHTVQIGNRTRGYHLFDVECTNYEEVRCRLVGYANLSLPVEFRCGNVERGMVKVSEGDEILLRFPCEGNASVKIGDWEAHYPKTPLFRNSVDAGEGSWIYVFRNKTLILRKWGRGIVSFPELGPGSYELLIVNNGHERAKLVIERRAEAMVTGYVLAALIVLGSLALLLVD